MKQSAAVSIGTRILSLFLLLGFVSGQNRVSDKDLESLMRNLRDDAKSFRPVFEAAIKNRTIRKTNQEREARNLVEQFAKQTEAMLNSFKQTRKGDGLNDVLATGRQIDQIVNRLRLSGQVRTSWEKIQSELQQVSGAFGVPTENPRGVDNPSASAAPACSSVVGAERSQKLVQECLTVSPATHPPCNAQNSCVLIIDEIKRGCSLLARNAPQFCEEYK